MADKKSKFDTTSADQDATSISSTDLQYILSVNNKAIQIYVEVEKQNEQILEDLDNVKEMFEEFKEKMNNLSNDNKSIKEFLEEDFVEYEKKSQELIEKLKEDIQSVNDTSASAASSATDMMKNILVILSGYEPNMNKIDRMERNLFRLNVIFGSTTVLGILTLIAKALILK